MTRQEQLQFCTVCQNRSFDPKQGIVCGLTNEKPTFEASCKDYLEDPKEVRIEQEQKQAIKSESTKSIDKGRYSLFIIGGLYVLIGIFEGLFADGADLIFGIIDWFAAAIFIGLGIWSYKKPFLALIAGLSFYVLIIILMFVVEPSTLLGGIIWKILIIAYLVNAIVTAKNEKEVVATPDDLLDQV